MDRNTVLQDLHTYQTQTTSNTPPPQQQQQLPTQQQTPFQDDRMFDTQQILDGIDFTHFDSRLFTPPQQQPYMMNNNTNYLNMYPPQNNVLLQRYNSNGSTTSSNSQATSSYLPNYSPMAHYTASLQHQQYYSQQQQQHLQQLQQQLNTNTKKRKNANQNEEPTIQKKKKKKRTKIIDPNAPPKPKRNTGLNKPLILSPALSELMDGDKELSRPELVKKLWKYIKLNNLQDPSDRRFILCDEQLKKIFNQDRINSFGMNKDLSAHLTKKQEQTPLTPSEDDDFLSFIKE